MKQPLTSDVNLAGPPIDVIELERYHLTSAKTEAGKQKKDGVVASSGRLFSVAAVKQPLDFFWNQIFRHCGQAPTGDSGYR